MPNIFTPTLRMLHQEINTNLTRRIHDIEAFNKLMNQLTLLTEASSNNTLALYRACLKLINDIYRHFSYITDLNQDLLTRALIAQYEASRTNHNHQIIPRPQGINFLFLIEQIARSLRGRRGEDRTRAQVQNSPIQMTGILAAHGVNNEAFDELRSIIGQSLIQGEVVVVIDGQNRHYYGRDELLAWLRRNPINPLNRQSMSERDLVDATEEYRAKIRDIILEALADKPEAEQTQILSRLFSEFGWNTSAMMARPR